MDNAEFKYDIFISYSHADVEPVEKVARYLNDHGLKVWFDRWSLVPGVRWQVAAEDALKSSSGIALFIGPSSTSRLQQQEWQAALDLELRGTLSRIIPVFLPGATLEIPPLLQARMVVDLRHGIDDHRELIRAIVATGYQNEEDAVAKEINIGDDLQQFGDSEGALKQYEKALQNATALHAELHPITAAILNKTALEPIRKPLCHERR